jgi:hypothetical protein
MEPIMPVVLRKWRQFSCECIHKIEVVFKELETVSQGTFYIVLADYEFIGSIGLIDRYRELLLTDECIAELLRRNINIEDYLSTDGVASPYTLDPDLCYDTQCNR